MTTSVPSNRASGSLFGMAYGDALGKPTEFMPVARIEAEYGPGGPQDLAGDPAQVTDDTQMALAVGHALRAVRQDLTPQALVGVLTERFVGWLMSPDNNRAPGNTCLRACGALQDGVDWQQATVIDSKGCGANMRVTPVGLLPGLDLEVMAGVAQLQAALTHGHPTAVAASELTAYATRLLRDGLSLAEVLPALLDRCDTQRQVYREDWLGQLWQRSHDPDPVHFITRGWDECAAALATVATASASPDRTVDPCLATGAGWIAEEALATALYCALLYPDQPVAALGRAANTSGDSDSIACLAGAFLGASLGMAAWPLPWLDRIEYADQLATLGAAWD